MSEDLLPISATSSERALSTTVSRVSAVPVPARTMWSPQNCPVDLLPWLAWAFSVDEWDSEWTDAQKRASIAASYSIHRRKGTIGAVRRAIAALGLEVEIIEWFQETPIGDPYTFRVSFGIEQTPATQSQIMKLLAVVRSSKNLRSHMADVDVTINTRCGLIFGGVTLIGNEITIEYGHSLVLDGTWRLDGTQSLNGRRVD